MAAPMRMSRFIRPGDRQLADAPRRQGFRRGPLGDSFELEEIIEQLEEKNDNNSIPDPSHARMRMMQTLRLLVSQLGTERPRSDDEAPLDKLLEEVSSMTRMLQKGAHGEIVGDRLSTLSTTLHIYLKLCTSGFVSSENMSHGLTAIPRANPNVEASIVTETEGSSTGTETGTETGTGTGAHILPCQAGYDSSLILSSPSLLKRYLGQLTMTYICQNGVDGGPPRTRMMRRRLIEFQYIAPSENFPSRLLSWGLNRPGEATLRYTSCLILPWDHSVFLGAGHGEFIWLKHALDQNWVSRASVDPSGASLMQYALEFLCPKVIDFLLDAGDTDATLIDHVYSRRSPYAIALRQLLRYSEALKRNQDLCRALERVIKEKMPSCRCDWRRLTAPDLSDTLFTRPVSLSLDRLGYHRIHYAAFRGQSQDVEFLVRLGVPVDLQDVHGSTPLQGAFANRHYNVAAFLLQQGADVNAQDFDGLTALHLAVTDYHSETAQLLLAYDADPNIRDYVRMETPLNRLMSWNRHKRGKDIVDLLISAGADTEIPNVNGGTPLINAIGNPYSLGMFKRLHQLGANMNARDASGMTILHRIALRGEKDFISYLSDIEITIDTSIQDHTGRTALQILQDRRRGYTPEIFRGVDCDHQVEALLAGPDYAAPSQALESSIEGPISVRHRDGGEPQSMSEVIEPQPNRNWDYASLITGSAEDPLDAVTLQCEVYFGISAAASLLYEDEKFQRALEACLKDPWADYHGSRSLLRRCLLEFSAQLESEAETLLEKEVAAFLARYCARIFDAIQFRLRLPLGPPHNYRSELIEDLKEEDDDDERVPGEERVLDEPPNIRHENSKEFILSSNAFTRLLEGLCMKPRFTAAARQISGKATTTEGFNDAALKFHLDSLLSELDHAQPEKLDVQYEVSVPLLDSVKIFIEDRNVISWDRSPLGKPRRALDAGYVRMSWVCSCGRRRSETVPGVFAAELSKLVRRQCFTTRNITHAEPEQSSQATTTSNTADTSTIIETNAIKSTSLGAKALATTQGGQKSSSSVLEGPDSRPTGDQFSRMTPRRFIFLAITCASNRLRLSQLASQTLGTVDFAAQLRTEYRRLRGFWKSWFSIDKFSHCEFVKIEKFCAHHYSHRGLGIPEGDHHAQDYFYQPRPATWIPPISPEEFRHLFYHCEESLQPQPALGGLPFNKVVQNSKTLTRMLRTLSQPWRSVIREDFPTDTVSRIPQRLRYLDEAGAGREEIWGIHAREERSLKMVCLYIFLSLAPTFIFCFLYLFGYLGEADVQNATTPLVISLTCLAILFAYLTKRN